jgi:hypothetical protein
MTANTPITYRSGLGTRFDFQNSEFGQKGGLQWYPLSGLVSGLAVTVDSVTATQVALEIAPGQVRLDGNLINSPSAITFNINGTGFNTAVENKFLVFVNPTRKYPAATSNPAGPSDGDIYVNVSEIDFYQIVNEARIYNAASSSWVKYDLAKAPIGYGHNNMMLSDIEDSLGLSNISVAPEKPVFLKTQYPVYISSTPHASFRSSASFVLAEVTVSNSIAQVKTRIDVANI